MATIVRVGGGTDIAYEEVGRIKGTGYINADLTKYVALGLVQTWDGESSDPMTFLTLSEFKAKKKTFRSCDGTSSGGGNFAVADYVDDTKVYIRVTGSTSVGVILYGLYID